MNKIELFNDNFQNYKKYGIPKAQLVVKKYENDIETIEVEEVNQNTERGITGFGSSGKF